MNTFKTPSKFSLTDRLGTVLPWMVFIVGLGFSAFHIYSYSMRTFDSFAISAINAATFAVGLPVGVIALSKFAGNRGALLGSVAVLARCASAVVVLLMLLMLLSVCIASLDEVTATGITYPMTMLVGGMPVLLTACGGLGCIFGAACTRKAK